MVKEMKETKGKGKSDDKGRRQQYDGDIVVGDE